MPLREISFRKHGDTLPTLPDDCEIVDAYAGPTSGERTLLVRVSETDTEGVDDYPTNDDGEPLCTGKEDGQCNRTVDEPGGICWQHDIS